MEQDGLDPITRDVIEAVGRRDIEAVNCIAAWVMANEHSYEAARMALLGLAALDMTLPILSQNGELAISPTARLLQLAPGSIERLQEIEGLYDGESIVCDGCIISGSERRLRAWAAFLLALFHHMERNVREAAIWSERALGLDSEAAGQWGVWYYLWHAYLGLAHGAHNERRSGQAVSDDCVHAFAALDWAVEEALQFDPQCRDFSKTWQNLRALESAWEVLFLDDRCAALVARASMHEDGFAGKFLFESALPFATDGVERLTCHENIAMDILTLRHNREYIHEIENATEAEIAEADHHASAAWELAKRLTAVGEATPDGGLLKLPQDALRNVKGTWDGVRELRRDQEQLKNMSHAERQELLDKREQITICRDAGDLDRALQLCNWCLGRANRDPLAWWLKGQILMTDEKKDLDQAVLCLRSALALDPQDSDYYDSLALALICAQPPQLDEAKRLCDEGLALNPACESLQRTKNLADQQGL